MATAPTSLLLTCRAWAACARCCAGRPTSYWRGEVAGVERLKGLLVDAGGALRAHAAWQPAACATAAPRCARCRQHTCAPMYAQVHAVCAVLRISGDPHPGHRACMEEHHLLHRTRGAGVYGGQGCLRPAGQQAVLPARGSMPGVLHHGGGWPPQHRGGDQLQARSGPC